MLCKYLLLIIFLSKILYLYISKFEVEPKAFCNVEEV